MKTKPFDYALLLLTFVLWGSLYVVSKFMLGYLPTFMVSFLRFLLGDMVLMAAVFVTKPGKIAKSDYKYIALIGLVGYSLSVTVQLIGTKLAGAATASLINSLNPVAIMLMAAVILGEKLTVRKVISIAISIFGVYCILGSGTERSAFLGIVISLFSVLTWAFVSVIMRRVSQKYNPIQVTAYGLGIAVLCTCPIALFDLMHTDMVIRFGPVQLAALLYMGCLCTGCGHFLWNRSLSKIEASTCSMFYPVQPLVSAILGVLFLHESISGRFLFGAALIVVGLLLSLIRLPERRHKLHKPALQHK